MSDTMANLDMRLARGEATTDEVVNHLMTHHYTGLKRLVSNLLRDADAADDVVQRTLIIAAEKISQYQPHGNLKAWVYKIAINEANAHFRQQKSQRNFLQRWLNRDAPRSNPSPETQTVQSEQQNQIWDAVQQLKEKHRVPVVLRYLHNMPATEIAEVLDLPVGTIYSRLHYAHTKLFGLLSSEEATQ